MEAPAARAPFGDALKRAVARATRPKSPGAPKTKEAPASYVVNRRGDKVPVRFDLITERNAELCGEHEPRLVAIDLPQVTTEVVRHFRNGMTTRELDAETVLVCSQRAFASADYELLAARICVSDLHKRVPADPVEMLKLLEMSAASPRDVRASPELGAVVRRAHAAIRERLVHERDYSLRLLGFQSLLSSLMRSGVRSHEMSLQDTQPCERPQHAYMRVALGLFVCRPDGKGAEAAEAAFQERLAEAFDFYDALSSQLLSQATPTMLNAGTVVPQLSSCFQLAMGDDLDSILGALKDAGMISKWSGGVSVWMHALRSQGAPIRRTTGQSSGLKYLLRLWDDMQRYVDQGGSRPGAFVATIADHHPDILQVLRQARLDGAVDERLRAQDIKIALWVSDLFMETLVAQIEAEERAARGEEADPAAGTWHLFDPDAAPGLHLVHGEEFRRLYRQYASEGRAKATIKAGDIALAAGIVWFQRGIPYVMYKDAINAKSNMSNVAPICSSNLCCEIILPSWSDFDAKAFGRFHPDNVHGGEYGVCTLGAVNLAAFVDGKSYDFRGHAGAVALEVRALDRVLDRNYTPTEECRRSMLRHRTIGIGVIGLANVFARLRLAYNSAEARRLARAIAAVHYYGAVLESARLAETEGAYSTFEGSPMSKGILQPDMWVARKELAPDWEEEVEAATGGVVGRDDWRDLRERVKKGVRNAYLIAYMPTATSANVVGQNESFEPFTANVYTRKTRSGEHTIINRDLIAELTELGLWDERMRRRLIAADGSVQGLPIPDGVKSRFRTAREMHPGSIVAMAKAMAPFVCQSMSMNHWLEKPSLPVILRALVDAWKAGLKTGLYYCHTRAAGSGQKTSVAADAQQKPPPKEPTDRQDRGAESEEARRDQGAGAPAAKGAETDSDCRPCARRGRGAGSAGSQQTGDAGETGARGSDCTACAL